MSFIVKGKCAGGGIVHGAQDFVNFYEEAGINPLNEKGLVFMNHKQRSKQSTFYIALRDGGIPELGYQVVVGKVTKGW